MIPQGCELEEDERFHGAFQGYGFGSGFLKLSILKMASEKPVYGYQIMKEISLLTDGDWRPSPGSVYPALQELEGEGLLEGAKSGRKRVYTITPDGLSVLRGALNHLMRVVTYLRRIFPEQSL